MEVWCGVMWIVEKQCRYARVHSLSAYTFFLYGFDCGLVGGFLFDVVMSYNGFVYTYLYEEDFFLAVMMLGLVIL